MRTGYALLWKTHLAHYVPLLMGAVGKTWSRVFNHLLLQLPPPHYIVTAELGGDRGCGAGSHEPEVPKCECVHRQMVHFNTSKVACTWVPLLF